MAVYHLSKDPSRMKTEARGVAALLRDPLSALRLWSTIASERRDLAELDDRLLRDIGVARDDALQEAQRPFWETDDR